MKTKPAPKEQKVGTITFSHPDTPVSVYNPSPLESTYSAGETTDVPLGQYLARPVKIFEINPGLGTTTHTQFYPWKIFLEDTEVKKRIEGFRHVRGNLKIRAVCTGNPFMYGKYCLSYRPFFDRSVFPFCGSFSDARIIQATSCPHIYIDPTTSEGGEMTLPYFSPFNWIDLTETRMRQDMGALDFVTIVPLRHANSASGTFNIQVFAWMENAEICTPTTSPYDTWTLQSTLVESSTVFGAIFNFFSFLLATVAAFHFGETKLRTVVSDSVRSSLVASDEEPQSEFAEKPISTTASAVAKAAGTLEMVPILAPYAKATEMAASVVAGVARAFGFSRPQNVENIEKYRYYYGEFATTNTHEPIPRLALDVKGEMTVDPRTVGLDGTDEMSFKSILGKEVAFQKFDWAEGSAPGTTIGDIAVTPMHGDTDTTVTPVRFVMTPQAGVASLFRYWSGTMIFRFQVVASALHRGKIRVSYDPVEMGASNVNQVYSRIIDISEMRDFEVPINWHAPTPFLEVENKAIPASGQWNSATTLATFDPRYNNGVLRLEVFTPLQSPDPAAGNDITIIAHVRCGDDFKFGKPSAWRTRDWTYISSNLAVEPQSLLDDEVPNQDNEPVTGTPLENIGAGEAPVSDKSHLVYFGETIESIRTLLRRYAFHDQHSTASNVRLRATPASGTPLTLLEFVMPWYVGWRGSLRYKGVRLGNERWVVSIGDGLSGASYTAFNSAEAGMAVQADIPEFEVPFYSRYRFAMSQANQGLASGAIQSYGEQDPNAQRYQAFCLNPTNGSVTMYTAVGEDFGLFFYTGVPPIYAVP